MECISHDMGTALLSVTMSLELFKHWQLAVGNSEKNTPLCVSPLSCGNCLGEMQVVFKCLCVVKISKNIEYEN